jgi:hypothetical protein
MFQLPYDAASYDSGAARESPGKLHGASMMPLM